MSGRDGLSPGLHQGWPGLAGGTHELGQHHQQHQQQQGLPAQQPARCVHQGWPLHWLDTKRDKYSKLKSLDCQSDVHLVNKSKDLLLGAITS